MTSGPKKLDSRGGSRTGSGRKPHLSITQRQIKRMVREAGKMAREHGKTIDQILLGIIYDDRVIEMKDHNHKPIQVAAVDDKTRVAAIKVWKEFTMGKYVEQNITDNRAQGPTIYLPEMLPDPARVVQKEGNA